MFPVDEGSSGWMSSFQWIGLSSIVGQILGADPNGALDNRAIQFFILGLLVELGRRIASFAYQRFQFTFHTTAHFEDGDPTYDWIAHFLSQQDMSWRRMPEFRVKSKSSARHWSVNIGRKRSEQRSRDSKLTVADMNAEYWRGYWLDVHTSANRIMVNSMMHMGQAMPTETGSITITLYTRKIEVLSELIEAARLSYTELSRSHVTIHIADQAYSSGYVWSNVKRKARRALDSIILPEGLLSSLVLDVQDFMNEDTENWFMSAGIPYRRGILLYGPPGTGKTSTIYALAGELNLEIYSLSLASDFMNDSVLQNAASSVPKHSILLIEDIDCAFASREDADTRAKKPAFSHVYHNSGVTLSGLLNVIDGVGSEEGRLFFCTTNYIDRLDPALLRPGRIDRKIEYGLSTQSQTKALFNRFFPAERFHALATTTTDEKVPITATSPISSPSAPPGSRLALLASRFAALIPEAEFSTAELQGFLLSCKTDPERATAEVGNWVSEELAARTAKRNKELQKQAREETKKLNAGGMGIDMDQLMMRGAIPSVGSMQAPFMPTGMTVTPAMMDAGMSTYSTMPQHDEDGGEPGLDASAAATFNSGSVVPSFGSTDGADDASAATFSPENEAPPLHAPTPAMRVPMANTLRALPSV
ncbi:P-loop containing nucleoside triphosphate hydrolase protein [Schizophyllum amplum]|uniref:P-loop containing nucleoside triphosphate hydrolase protein n=1 Tax=Schizophyllum amplum TaxID=97359 RepID=A0A550C1D6_9AGAR|nr:P-loop containing nucleoside triphosphate hydrolase protein [Auriculariopsis ampla]